MCVYDPVWEWFSWAAVKGEAHVWEQAGAWLSKIEGNMIELVRGDKRVPRSQRDIANSFSCV
ncbi:hypothetical protein KSX_09290 [Ktedonospora formicarum]|uniref:Uncharacterized protein n=1 Tax=Ktedonospora formicarum TaxID=2778364 RepID=A0A8J3HVJ2_9CHLR|nr:hypothetical protein KSX_09290 [Ktedonospora formicarum]